MHGHIHCALEVKESSEVDRGPNIFRVNSSLDVNCLSNRSQDKLWVCSRCHLHLFRLEHVELGYNCISVCLLKLNQSLFYLVQLVVVDRFTILPLHH
jgi:hypothetical protein